MCGVCGVAVLEGPFDPKWAEHRVQSMVDALAHRGPDDAAVSVGSTAVLGATRLAIRGLSSDRQPIVDEASGLIVVCNGEIDNHRDLRVWLKSRGRTVQLQTDIAVISEMYLELGESFVDKLIGVFAIAIWDPKKKELILARDRAGERPIFFNKTGNVVQFATEIASLVEANKTVFTRSSEAIQEYLTIGCLGAPTTPYNEIEKVHPGEIIVFSAQGLRRRRFWRWTMGQSPKQVPSLDVFDKIFRNAVGRQSDVDVPLGIFLSGGLDSSLIASVARSVRPNVPLPAYTLRFNENSYDEGHYAELVAKRLGLETIPVLVNPLDLPDTLADLIDYVGEPLADPAWIPTALLARRASLDVKMVLAGEGGDELFGGYPTHLAANWGEAYASLPQPLKNTIRGLINLWPVSDKKITIPFLLKRFVGGMHEDGIARHLLWKANIPLDIMTRLGITAPDPRKAEYLIGELLDSVQRIDLETTLAEGLLTKSDRAGMRSAVEVRAPFLDQEVMEFAATLPVSERVRGFSTKVFLKKYAERYLPHTIIYRRKRGLSVPLSSWLRGPLYDWTLSRLTSKYLAQNGINTHAAVELLEQHRDRLADHGRALWALIVLSEWLIWDEKRSQKAKAN